MNSHPQLPYNCAVPQNFFKFAPPRASRPAQVGYGFGEGQVYFSGVRRQKGAGLGGLFGVMARRLVPFMKRFVLPHAASALRGIASDVIDGNQSFSNSFKEHSVGALKDMGRSFLNQTGSGRVRVKTSKRRTGKKRIPKKRKALKGGKVNSRTKSKKVKKTNSFRKRKPSKAASQLRYIF